MWTRFHYKHLILLETFKILENKLSYAEIYRIIKEKDKKRFLYTIEFFPEEGKYHSDGHRVCNINLHPQESNKLNKITKPVSLIPTVKAHTKPMRIPQRQLFRFIRLIEIVTKYPARVIKKNNGASSIARGSVCP